MRPRQFVFSQLVAGGTDPTAAALKAGYKASCARRTAARLLKATDTQTAITEATRGKADVLQHLEAARQLAMEKGDAGAAVLAVRSIARIRGVV